MTGIEIGQRRGKLLCLCGKLVHTNFSETDAVTANLELHHTTYKMNFFWNVLEETAAFISWAEEHALSSVLEKGAAGFSRTLVNVPNYTVSQPRRQYSLWSHTCENFISYRLLERSLTHEILCNCCLWHPLNPWLMDHWVHGYTSSFMFLFKQFRHFNLSGL
jgi:hypothetical protein